MGSLEQPPFRRARFDPLGLDPVDPAAQDNIRSLPDLINFNAEVNPDHTFCLQAEAKPTTSSTVTRTGNYGATRITFRELKYAVDSCSWWLKKTFIQPDGANARSEGTHSKPQPVALYLESDVGLFIYLAALLSSGIPAVLLSARLSAESVRHLLKETGAQSILLSKRTERLMAQEVADIVDVKSAAPYTVFLETSASAISVNAEIQQTRIEVDEKDLNVLILHSSGTTGLPKPIRLAHRYPLGYAACHKFDENENIDWLNLSTLPLYHGFGLLAPCLSLSVGLCCCFPPSSIIPAAHSTLELLSTFGVRSMMTVPSILEDIINLPEEERNLGLQVLRRMRFIAVGGGPLNPDVGTALVKDGVKILNHYGATEIGAIAPIFQPGADYDYRYLRLRTDLGLQLHPVATEPGAEGPERFKLVGYPFGWDRSFEIQDELIKRPDSQYLEVKILGRRDDLIVLKNGEKVIPRMLEAALSEDPAVKTAVCVGQGYFEVTVLIEPSNSAPEDPEALVDHVWGLVSAVNPSLDQHAQISSKKAIIIKPPGKVIPRSDKGSVMRREVQTVFGEEISAAYEALELESFNTGIQLDAEHLQDGIYDLVKFAMGDKMALHSCEQINDDLFELGMDSLQATRLARYLNSSIQNLYPEALPEGRLKPAFIYQNASVRKLTEAVGTLIRGEDGGVTSTKDRAHEIRAVADEYLQALDADDFGDKAVVLLTGSTGNLGAHTLGTLATHDRVARIICLNRHIAGSNTDFRTRQEHVNSTAGISLSALAWDKVEFLGVNMQAADLGLMTQQLRELSDKITHIVHLAWPMDFNRQLNNFRPQLNFLKTLIHLARSAHRARPHVKPRLLLASSISVVRHYKEQTGSSLVLEEPLDNPLVTTAMGYAEAKWVCERMLLHVGQKYPQDCDPMIVRIGQLSGPEKDGIWKTEEHMPALVKASQTISAFPSLQGDFSWIPVDRAAKVLLDILFQVSPAPAPIYHLENPIRQPLSTLGAFVADELQLKEKSIPYEEWLERVISTGQAPSLVEFFKHEFQALADGTTVLDTSIARGVSPHLQASCGISKDLIVEYLRRWKKLGFLA